MADLLQKQGTTVTNIDGNGGTVYGGIVFDEYL